jgi:hypothetical protein
VGPLLVWAYNRGMRWLVLLALSACGGDKTSPTTGSAASGSASAVVHPIDAAPEVVLAVATGSDGVPLVCGDWRAAIEKLATCNELPQSARDSLLAVYNEASAGWGQLPADAKKNLVGVCHAGADSIVKGAKATCGW